MVSMLETLYSRKSIRNFNGQNISDEQLKEILKAAYAAPVGRAAYDSLMITVITNREFIDKWQSAAAAINGNPDMKVLYNAPTVILVSSKVAPAPACNLNYSNAAIVVHNMALTATEMGVGACHIWGAVMAMNANPGMADGFNLPQGMVPCCALALGQTDEKYEVRQIPESRIHTEYFK